MSFDGANEFNWEQRGRLDFTCGIPFSQSPAPDIFQRDEWEKGWLLASDAWANRLLLAYGHGSQAKNVLLGRLRRDL